MRPDSLSGDRAGAVETITHALVTAEAATGQPFQVVLIVEPTSPLRRPDDLLRAATLLVDTGADSVVTVSPLPAKAHPLKLLEISGGRLQFHAEGGGAILARQQLDENYFWRDGLCYALTRDTLLERKAIITHNSLPLVTDRPVVNIDEPIELRIAELLLEEQESKS
jgi:CMP-N,N'-diacetyllegionaminic acid synthase